MCGSSPKLLPLAVHKDLNSPLYSNLHVEYDRFPSLNGDKYQCRKIPPLRTVEQTASFLKWQFCNDIREPQQRLLETGGRLRHLAADTHLDPLDFSTPKPVAEYVLECLYSKQPVELQNAEMWDDTFMGKIVEVPIYVHILGYVLVAD